MTLDLTGGTKVGQEVDFGPRFRRVSIPVALEEASGRPLPDFSKASFSEAVSILQSMCQQAHLGKF
jgi:hypothetical protein